MKSSDRRVIKSDDVKFLRAPKNMPSGSNHSTDGVNHSQPSIRVRKASGLERMKEMYEKKIQLAEQKAYDRGLSDGILQGMELQKSESFKTIQAMTGIVKDVSELKKNILDHAEEQIIQLSLAIAEKVIHHEVTTNREVIRNVLREAIKNIVDRENMKIRVHPHDFRYMMEIKSDFLQKFDGIRNIVFEEDEAVLRGGAIIETLFGEVDARLDQQYHEIKTLMTSPDSN
jgi:flagellar assembly protein FliH